VKVREAPFALRVVRRKQGDAAILYRRRLTGDHKERLDRVAAISTLACSAGAPLLRASVRSAGEPGPKLNSGPYHPLDADWGARVACYALVARGLRDAARLHRAAENLLHSDGAEAAWWFGLMVNGTGRRAIRALRILVEAVE
jgi:hypothetical protein